MNDERYVYNYLTRMFSVPLISRLARDTEMEERLIRFGQIEYQLQLDLKNKCDGHSFLDSQSLMDGSKYLVFCYYKRQFQNCIGVAYYTEEEEIPSSFKYFNYKIANHIKNNTLKILGYEDKEAYYDWDESIGALPLFGLYCRKNNKKFDTAADELWHKVRTNEPLNLVSMFSNKKIYRYYDVFYYGSQERAIAYVLIFICNNKKVFLPGCKLNVLGFQNIASSPLTESLYNQELLQDNTKRQPQIIILTDSIEIASHNQSIVCREGVHGIVWLSWFGGKEAIPKIDWGVLKNKTVYYLLKEHSGHGGKTTHEIALEVEKALCREKNITVKFISYLQDGIKYDFPRHPHNKAFINPEIYKPEDFWEAMQAFEQQRVFFYEPVPYANPLIGNRKILMTPFIYDRSTTLIWGKADVFKTSFAIYIAKSLAYRKNTLKNWNPVSWVPVQYFYFEHKTAGTFGDHLKIMGDEGTNFLYNSRFLYKFQHLHNIIDYIVSCCFKSRVETPNVLVLDGIPLVSHNDNTLVFNDLLTQLRDHGWTVIVVVTHSTIANTNFSQKLAVENSFHLQRIPESTKFTVDITSAFKGPKKMQCKLNFEADPPTLSTFRKESKRVSYSKKQRESLKEQILKSINSNITDVERRKSLRPKIKESMYKKLKWELIEEGKIVTWSLRRYNGSKRRVKLMQMPFAGK